MSDEAQSSSNAPAEPSGQQVGPEAAAKPNATPQPKPGETAAQAARRWKLAVNGAEEETDDAGLLAALIDTHGEEGLRNIAQLSKSARRKMGELTHKEKQLLEAAEDLRDPRRAFSLLERIHGRKAARQMIEDRYAEWLEEEALAPEERERRQLKSEVETLRQERERLKREKEERELARTAQEQQRTIGKQFAAALSEVGLDATPHTLARMAALAEAALDDGAPFDPRELAREVARDYEGGEVAGLLRKLAASPEKLAKMLGDEGVRAFRKWDVERVKGSQRAQPQVVQQPQARQQREERQRASVDDFFESLKRR